MTGGGGYGVYHCLKPDIYPGLLRDIFELHARPADS